MEAQQSIKVSLVGFNEKMASSIAYFLDKQKHAPTPFKLTNPNDEQAMILVDGDSIDGQVYLTDIKSDSHKILVARYKVDKAQNYPWLMKPVIPNELIKKLLALSVTDPLSAVKDKVSHFIHDKNHSLLKHALTNDQPNPKRARATISTPTESNNFYQPKLYLQGVLQRCLNKATKDNPLMQANLPFGDLLVDTGNSLVYLMIGQKHIRIYERLQLTELVMIRPISNTDQAKNLTQKDHIVDLDDLLWDLSFGASCGRLPSGTDIDQLMQLKHWPNLTRIRNAEHACQVSAIWSQNPMSIRQVVEQLKVDYKSVYGFYAAAKATGLLEQVKAGTTASRQPAKSPAKPSMMARLLSHLRQVS